MACKLWYLKLQGWGCCISLSNYTDLAPSLRQPVMTEDEDTNALVTKAEFNQLLTAMERVQDQMQTMKHELSTEREAANESLAKRIQLDCDLVFKNKMYEKQYCLNEEV